MNFAKLVPLDIHVINDIFLNIAFARVVVKFVGSLLKVGIPRLLTVCFFAKICQFYRYKRFF